MKPLDLIILLLTIFLSACQDKQKEIITLLVKEWQGKQILFPENMSLPDLHLIQLIS